MTFTLVVLVTMVTHISIAGVAVGDAPAMAVWSQAFGWQSDCERAGEAILKELGTAPKVTVRFKCIQVR